MSAKITDFKFYYTPGDVLHTNPSELLRPYISELSHFNELIVDEDNLKYLLSSDNITKKEIIRCIKSLYNSVNRSRFNLAIAQLKQYPFFLSDNPPEKSHMWIACTFLNNAIIGYQSSFDLLLQILWIHSGIYKNYNYKDEDGNIIDSVITTKSLPFILTKCRWKLILEHSNQIDPEYFNKIRAFIEEYCYTKINDAANCLKHRQEIIYDKLGEDVLISIESDNYNSLNTYFRCSFDEMVDWCKQYHHSLYEIVKILIPSLNL